MSDAFFGAVKEKRDEVLAKISEQLENEGGHYRFDDAIRDIDSVISGVLDVVEEQYESLITATAVDSEGEDVSVELSITTELSTLFMETVNT